MADNSRTREEANQLAFMRMTGSDPVLVDIRPAIEVVPGMTATTILTSGAPMPWTDYVGGQRDAIIGTALFEGLAETREDAIARLESAQVIPSA